MNITGAEMLHPQKLRLGMVLLSSVFAKLISHRYKKALGIDRIHTEYYSWRSKTLADGAQIDIIIDRADNMINLCEVKYSEHEYQLDKEEFFKINHRIEAFEEETQTTSTILPTMITTFGLAKGMYSDQITTKLTLSQTSGFMSEKKEFIL